MGKVRVKTIGDDELELKEKKERKQKKEAKKTKANPHSKSYVDAKTKIDMSKSYTISDGIELLRKLKKAKFDETVELHLTMSEQGISGKLTLPYGTGKKTRVVIADDNILLEVEKGKIDFDILVADPSMMPCLL